MVVVPRSDTLFAIGETAWLGAVVVGVDGSLIARVSVFWASSAPGVVSVGRTSGGVTAVAEGTATIRASAGPATGTATVSVIVR